MIDRLVAVAVAVAVAAAAAEALAQGAGPSPRDPEPRIAANALLGLWPIQFQELGRYLDETRTPEQLHQAVTDQAERAVRLIGTGLSSYPTATPHTLSALAGAQI